MPQAKLAQLSQALEQRAVQQLLRAPVTLERYSGRLLFVAGKSYINFSGNDYLGLATAATVLQAYADGAAQFGAGSSGSPLVTGQHAVHQQLCHSLCDWLNLERVLLFSSGFAANQAMLQTLSQKTDTLLMDKLSHASLIDGALHSNAALKRFAHNDLKWRNLLVDDQGQLFLIDCPNGDFWRGFWLKYRITKDLACLDKVAKYHLSATQRLRFYLQYRGHQRLNASDKKRVREVVRFFEGRE